MTWDKQEARNDIQLINAQCLEQSKSRVSWEMFLTSKIRCKKGLRIGFGIVDTVSFVRVI